MTKCPSELKRRYKEGRVIPFVGAGVSMSVTWEVNGKARRGPSWNELVDEATRQLEFSCPALARVRGSDLQILEYYKQKKGGQIAGLTNWFVENMKPPDQAIKDSVLLKSLAGLRECEKFYTTNYDNFLERALELSGRSCTAVVQESQMGQRSSKCQVVKFHGDLNHPDQIVLTESDYERRMTLSNSLDLLLRADLLGRVAVFVGYSFRDPNVAYLYRVFVEQFVSSDKSLQGPRAYIFVADPSEFERELFAARKMEVLEVRGSSFSEDIAQILQELET